MAHSEFDIPELRSSADCITKIVEDESKEIGMSNIIIGGESHGGIVIDSMLPLLKEKLAGIFSLLGPPSEKLGKISKAIKDTPTLVYLLD